MCSVLTPQLLAESGVSMWVNGKRVWASFSPENHGEEGRMALERSIQSRVLCI